MFLLAGLGNPGEKYENTRHNVGFMALDEIQATSSFSLFSKKDQALISEGRRESFKVMLIKPQSFMNLSGPVLARFLSFFKIPIERCIVFHDDLDLPLGKVKVKTGGGDGGHNGLKSLDQHIGKNYQRVRIGIDRPVRKEMVSHYVLDEFTQEEKILVKITLHKVGLFFPLLLSADQSLFMTRMSEL